MEIDTGDSLPAAQSPYTLPLKHYEWVQKEIETLEKAGVIVKNLFHWASPVIMVPKKSAPDEPPRTWYRLQKNQLVTTANQESRQVNCMSFIVSITKDRRDVCKAEWVKNFFNNRSKEWILSHKEADLNQHLWYLWLSSSF